MSTTPLQSITASTRPSAEDIKALREDLIARGRLAQQEGVSFEAFKPLPGDRFGPAVVVETSVTGEPVAPLKLTSEERYERDRLFMRDTRSPSQLAALGYDAFLTPIAVDVNKGTVTDLETGNVYKSFEKQLYNEDGSVGELWKGYSRQASAEELAERKRAREFIAALELESYLQQKASLQAEQENGKVYAEMQRSSGFVAGQILQNGKPIIDLNVLGGYGFSSKVGFESSSLQKLVTEINAIFSRGLASNSSRAIEDAVARSGLSGITFLDLRSATTQSFVERQATGQLLKTAADFMPKVTDELINKIRANDPELATRFAGLTAEIYENRLKPKAE
ncbi:MAG: hypothetical protein SF002_15560 [Alphaproteobacteria bacterium]|nr:hypothetical protein [Alphaproteobacteria bacterium]